MKGSPKKPTHKSSAAVPSDVRPRLHGVPCFVPLARLTSTGGLANLVAVFDCRTTAVLQMCSGDADKPRLANLMLLP